MWRKRHYEKTAIRIRNSNSALFPACLRLSNMINLLDLKQTSEINRNFWDFENLKSINMQIIIGNGQVIKINNIGTIKTKCNNSDLEFRNVLLNGKITSELYF